MSNLQLQVARATDAWRSLVVDERRSILKPFNLEVRLDVLISDPTPTLPKIKYGSAAFHSAQPQCIRVRDLTHTVLCSPPHAERVVTWYLTAT